MVLLLLGREDLLRQCRMDVALQLLETERANSGLSVASQHGLLEPCSVLRDAAVKQMS